jgi:hypothetical protein
MEYEHFNTPPEALKFIPASIQHTIAALALTHKSLTTVTKETELPEQSAQLRLQYHAWRAVSCLNYEISRNADVDQQFGGVLWFLMIELMSNHSNPTWRLHLLALQQLLDEHGGISHMYYDRPYQRQLFHIFIFDTITSNTTCASSSLMQAAFHQANIDWIVGTCAAADYPTFPCPQPLLAVLIEVNFIREQSYQQGSRCAPRETVKSLLSRVEGFSPRSYASLKPRAHQPVWERVAAVFRAAAAIYILSSLLDSIPTDDRSSKIAAFHEHRPHLLQALADLVFCPDTQTLVKFGIIWPVVVAGYAAGASSLMLSSSQNAEGSDEAVDQGQQQDSVRAMLLDLGRNCGIAMPFYALRVLNRFWSSDSTSRTWDECFAAGCAFVV